MASFKYSCCVSLSIVIRRRKEARKILMAQMVKGTHDVAVC
jgi:hypothetical protein